MYNTYPQHQNHGPQHNGYGYAPMQQPMPMQQMPMAAPVAQSATASKGLLMVAGIAVVGAAAFGGVMLVNSSSQPEQTAASSPSTVLNIPSEINIPGLNTHSDPASSPVVVNNPAPVRVFTPSAPRSNNTSTAPVQQQAPVVQSQTPANTKPEDTKPEDKKPEDKKPEDKKPEDKKDGNGTTTTPGGGGTTTPGGGGTTTPGGGGTTTPGGGGTTTAGGGGTVTPGGGTTTPGGGSPDDLIDYGGCACG
jgi:outer membrane biosynthesis protein TonB